MKPSDSFDIHHAAIEGNTSLSVINQLRAATSEQLNAFNDDDKTPLLLAIEHGHRDFAQHLVKYGANTTLGDNNGTTPILLAAYYCDSTSLTAMIRSSKEINKTTRKDRYDKDIFNYLFAMTIPGYQKSEEKNNPKINAYDEGFSQRELNAKKEFGAIYSCPGLYERMERIMNLCLRADTSQEYRAHMLFGEFKHKHRQSFYAHARHYDSSEGTIIISQAPSLEEMGNDIEENYIETSDSNESKTNRERAATFPDDQPSTTPKPHIHRGRRFSFTSGENKVFPSR